MIKTPKPIFDTLKNHDMNSSSHLFADDLRLAYQFLYSYRGSQATFNTYRREIERLLQWSTWIAQKSLPQLKREHVEEFIEFCKNPPLSWIGLKTCDRFVTQEGKRQPNPEWRPFVVKSNSPQDFVLSQKSLQSIFAVLGSFFTFLVQENYVASNPVLQIRQKSKFLNQATQMPVRRLSELQWTYLIETTEKEANRHSDYERSLFIINALYSMYLRISELSANERWEPQMGHFFRDSDGNWWFKTLGKGNKERQIVVSDAMLDALKRYRHYRGLSPLPSVGENTPLIVKKMGKGAITSTRQIRKIVQYCFDRTIERLVEDGFQEESEQLKAATVHWLRHTGISDDVKHRPREHVRDDAGHSSSITTDRYIDVELRERHASGRKKTIKLKY